MNSLTWKLVQSYTQARLTSQVKCLKHYQMILRQQGIWLGYAVDWIGSVTFNRRYSQHQTLYPVEHKA